jgi:hypothetical protein
VSLRTGIGLACSALAGAAVMYLVDPQMGKRRISLIRDQFESMGVRTGRMLSGRSRDLRNRIYGLYCETRSLLGSRCASEDSVTTEGRRTG